MSSFVESETDRFDNRRLSFLEPLPRDSRFFKKNVPQYWLEKIEMANLLEGCLNVPLGQGTMSEKDIMKVHNLLIMLAYGKEHVPYIVYFQANKTRTAWDDVGLIFDKFLHPEDKTEVIEVPTFAPVDKIPVRNVLQLRSLARSSFGQDICTHTPGMGLSIVRADEHNGCIPGVFAIAGTNYGAGLVAGRLLRGQYTDLLTAQGSIAARNAASR